MSNKREREDKKKEGMTEGLKSENLLIVISKSSESCFFLPWIYVILTLSDVIVGGGPKQGLAVY